MEARKEKSALKPVSTKGFKSVLPKSDYVHVQNTPGGEIKTVPVSEFIKTVNMTGWCETNLIRDEDKAEVQGMTGAQVMRRSELVKIYKEISTYQKDLVISYVNDQVKYSVVTQKPIPAGAFFATMSGVIEPKDDAVDASSYGVRLRKKTTGQDLILDSENYGNIGRFFLHAPDKVQITSTVDLCAIEDYRFAGIKPTDVLTANAELFEISGNKYPIMVLQASENILRGQQIVWNYGRVYWSKHDAPLLMAKDNSFINPDQYVVYRPMVCLYRGESRAGFEDPHADLTLSLDQLKADFKNNGALLVKAEATEAYGISEELFFTQYYQQPHALVLTFRKPDIVLPLKSQESSSQGGEKETEESSKASGEKAVSTTTLFGQSKKQKVLNELNRISESLSLPQWGYSPARDTAFLSAPVTNTTEIKKLKDYLYLKALNIEYGVKAGTTDPLLMVKKPSVTQLRCISAFMERPRLEIKS